MKTCKPEKQVLNKAGNRIDPGIPGVRPLTEREKFEFFLTVDIRCINPINRIGRCGSYATLGLGLVHCTSAPIDDTGHTTDW